MEHKPHGFPRASRLTRGQEITLVRRAGVRFRGNVLELQLVKRDVDAARVGVIVPRHSQSAVARNRVKRRLREIIRVERIGMHARGAVVVVALPSAYHATFRALRADLLTLRARAAV